MSYKLEEVTQFDGKFFTAEGKELQLNGWKLRKLKQNLELVGNSEIVLMQKCWSITGLKRADHENGIGIGQKLLN